MNRKVFASLIAVIILLGLLAGCGGGDGSSSSSSGLPESSQELGQAQESSCEPGTQLGEPQNIVLWHSMTDYAGEEMDKYIRDFNATVGQELNITVEAVFQGSYSDSTTKLRTILQSDLYEELPDVMQIDATGVVDYQNTEYAFTVDDAIAHDSGYDLSQIVHAPLKAWSYGGVQLGMPFSSSTTVMYYNKTILDDAGVTEAPTTFAEIAAVAERLPDTNSAGADLVVYSQIPNTPTLTNWIGQIPGSEYNASYIVNNRNGREGNATQLVCDEEGTLLSFLTEWKNMHDAGALQNSSDGLSDMFYAGQLVFYTTSTSNLNTLLTTVGDSFEIGCAYFPRVNADANYGATISGAALFMFHKGDDAKAMAGWELVKYLSSAEVQAQFSMATGYFPVNQSSYELGSYQDFVAQYPQMEVGIRQVEMTSEDLMGAIVGPSVDFYYEIQNQISGMLDDGISPEDTVESISVALNNLLEQYNRAN